MILLSLQMIFFLIIITLQTIVVNTAITHCGARERLYRPYFNSFNNNHNYNNHHYQSEWQNDAGMNKVSNYRVSDNEDTKDISNDVSAALKQRNNIDKLLTYDNKRNFETLLSGITGNYYNRYVNAKNKRASFPSVYPEIMTDSGKTLNGKPGQLLSPHVNGANADLNYNSLLNQLSQLQTSGQLASLANANTGPSSSNTAAGNDNGGTSNERTKANKPTYKTDGIKETADTGSDTGINYKCILNEHLILCLCVCVKRLKDFMHEKICKRVKWEVFKMF